ncbi:hypothetical protein BGW41_006745 [Actinomortierella wolfii]|nr:hypothetical protein BGW41_006745 [Actinomortierella wolfii]
MNSTQSLYNHVKGSSSTASKKRKVCEKVTEVSDFVRRNRKPFRDPKDAEADLFNAWLIEDAPAAQGSDCCVPVVYDPSTHEEDDTTENSDESLKEIMQATLKALGEIKERMTVIETQQHSLESSLAELQSQMSAMTKSISSIVALKQNESN